MSHQKLVSICRSRRTIEVPHCGGPIALSVAMALAAVAGLGSSEPAHAGPSGPTHVRFCDTTISGGLNVLHRSLRCDVSPALTVSGGVLDLRKHTLICAPDEKGNIGTGIVVMGSGATVRNGKIKNCNIGVLVEGDGGHRLEHLTVTSPGLDDGDYGIRVTSDNNVLVGNLVTKSPGEGFRVEGDFNLLKHNNALKNGDHGFQAQGSNNTFLWNKAEENEGDGFRSRDGSDNRFFRNVANDNGDSGFRIRASNNLIIGNNIKGNALPCGDPLDAENDDAGIAVTNDGAGNFINRNKVKGNCIGINVHSGSDGNRITYNVSLGNTLDMNDGNEDCDQNEWVDNKFKTSDPACIE